MSRCLVSLSEQVFFTVVTSALEAFNLDHVIKAKDEKQNQVETYGHLWGYVTKSGLGESVYRIVMADTSTAAERDTGSTTPAPGSYEAKQQFVDAFFPEIGFIGDYHSHPYAEEKERIKTELEIERGEFHRFSRADFVDAKYQQEELGRNYRIGLVATVYERNAPVQRQSKHLDEGSCIRFQYEDHTIWLKAYVWSGKDYRRKSDKMVHLICPNLGFNAEL